MRGGTRSGAYRSVARSSVGSYQCVSTLAYPLQEAERHPNENLFYTKLGCVPRGDRSPEGENMLRLSL